jgi:hypothetical protein
MDPHGPDEGMKLLLEDETEFKIELLQLIMIPREIDFDDDGEGVCSYLEGVVSSMSKAADTLTELRHYLYYWKKWKRLLWSDLTLQLLLVSHPLRDIIWKAETSARFDEWIRVERGGEDTVDVTLWKAGRALDSIRHDFICSIVSFRDEFEAHKATLPVPTETYAPIICVRDKIDEELKEYSKEVLYRLRTLALNFVKVVDILAAHRGLPREGENVVFETDDTKLVKVPESLDEYRERLLAKIPTMDE